MSTLQRVAIATDNQQVAAHFGRCREYTIADVDPATAAVLHRWALPSPGHEPDRLPRLLADHQVQVVIAGGMGPRAQQLFARCGIDCIIGASGAVDEVLTAFANGDVTTGASACDHVDAKAPRGEEV